MTLVLFLAVIVLFLLGARFLKILDKAIDLMGDMNEKKERMENGDK